jgi:hypothetical protein
VVCQTFTDIYLNFRRPLTSPVHLLRLGPPDFRSDARQFRPGPDSRRRACPDHWQVEATRQGRRAGGRYVLLLRRGRSAARHVSLLGLQAAAQQYLGQLRSVLSSEWLALALALGFQWQVATVTASLSAVCFRVFVSSLSYSVRVCVECLFSRSPGQAPYGAKSACAKRAASRTLPP